jgi:hypothetical protein
MRTNERNCSGCRYWSEMIAQSIGGRDVEAMCLATEGPAKGKYMVGTQTCPSFAKNTAGAVDDPPDYGDTARVEYGRQAAMRHANGRPVFAPDGTMLDDDGNRSIFDDVGE